jgi:transcriptional regulator with XRE-family HTH domain
MTQKELAKHLQVADSTLSYWEMGKYEPDNESLMKLSRFFRVPIDYILGGDFTRWDIDGENIKYLDVDTLRIADSKMSVSENVNTYSLQRTPTSLNRIEFEDLTQEEVDLIAEYAVFIKSRRKN